MKSLDKSVRRWTLRVNKTLGSNLESHNLTIVVWIVVFTLGFTISTLLNSQTIYCNIPNMRQFYHDCQQPQFNQYEKLPTIYVITPTYDRFVQKAELTRLSHTLMLVPNLHWIIIEDSDMLTDLVSKFVRRLKNEFNFHSITQLQAPTPEEYKLKKGDPSWKYPKGVWQRNKGLEWIRHNLVDLDRDGVIYFADDDNTYDLELFNEMRYTRKISVWPVGFVGGMLVERPLVNEADKIDSFSSMWERKRPFPLDMAGFAISVHLLISKPNAIFSSELKIGYIESHFLAQFVNGWSDLEPKAERCSKVLVWHTKTQAPALHEERKLKKSSKSDVIW